MEASRLQASVIRSPQTWHARPAQQRTGAETLELRSLTPEILEETEISSSQTFKQKNFKNLRPDMLKLAQPWPQARSPRMSRLMLHTYPTFNPATQTSTPTPSSWHLSQGPRCQKGCERRRHLLGWQLVSFPVLRPSSLVLASEHRLLPALPIDKTLIVPNLVALLFCSVLFPPQLLIPHLLTLACQLPLFFLVCNNYHFCQAC